VDSARDVCGQLLAIWAAPRMTIGLRRRPWL